MSPPLIFFLFCILSILHHMLPQAASSFSELDNVRYISDVLVINIKDRLEKPFEVVASVQSDDPVTIIEENGNYLKVVTADNKQGWIAKQYLKSELPKAHLIKQLKQDVVELKKQLALKPATTFEAAIEEKQHSASLCHEIQQKLTEAEKYIAQILEEQKALQHRSVEHTPAPSGFLVDQGPLSTDQLEQTPENYALLISEYEKRGHLITELQKTISKKDDHTRFLWFGAGATVFIIGMFAGKTSNRKKNKFTY